jgi:hypothetical protein
MPDKLADSMDWVGTIHKYKSPNDCVEGLIKLHLGWIALKETHVADSSRLRARTCPLNR